MLFQIRFSLMAIVLLALTGCNSSQPEQKPSNEQRVGNGTVHLSVEITVADQFPNAEEMAARNAITDDLDKKNLGEGTGAGGGFGAMDFSYKVKDEEAARKMISDTIGQHLPNSKFKITRLE